jgi:Spy/CpxP family protein refolding chaperone
MVAIVAAVAVAQPGPRRFAAGAPADAVAPPADAVKTQLGLTDAQVTALQQLRQQEATATQTIHQDIAAKQKSLRDQLNAGVTDAAALGRLLLDIEALRKRTETAHASYQTQAVATLTADQKTKLKTLEDAQKLQLAIMQAIGLNLLVPAEGMPGPGAPGGPGMQGPPGGGGRMMMRNPGPPLR